MDAWRNKGTNRNRACTKKIGLAISLVFSALLMTEAISSDAHSWLAWISLLPLFVAIRSLHPRNAAIFGALWGGGLYLFLIIADYSTVSATLTNFILITTIPTAYSSLGAIVTRRLGFSPMGLALGWIGVELALQPLGLSYGLLSPLRGYGPFLQMAVNFLGYGFVAFIIAYIGAVLSTTLRNLEWDFYTQQFKKLVLILIEYRSLETLLVFLLLNYRQGSPRGPPWEIPKLWVRHPVVVLAMNKNIKDPMRHS